MKNNFGNIPGSRPEEGVLSVVFRKKMQVIISIILLVGTALLYYRAYVTVDTRIVVLASSLPPEPDFSVPLPEEGHDLNALEKEWEQLSSLFNVSIPEAPGIPGILGGIARQARLVGIQGVTMETGERHSSQTLGAELPLFTWPVRLRFISEYVQLAQFVHALQSMPRVTEVLNISMRRYPPGLATEISLAVYSQMAPSLITSSKKEGTKKQSGTEETFEFEGEADTSDDMMKDEIDGF